MLKKIFWHLAVDAIGGDYLEFGVAFGNSMHSALYASKNARAKILGISSIERNFIGFDTFDGFASDTSIDAHSTWTGNLYNLSLEQIERKFRKFEQVRFVQCDATALSKPNLPFEIDSLRDGRKAAVILFDMDLYGPTASALQWIRPMIQQGTFLIFDEYFAFGGARDRGESLAVTEFLQIFPELELRQFSTYGAGGVVFIVNFL